MCHRVCIILGLYGSSTVSFSFLIFPFVVLFLYIFLWMRFMQFYTKHLSFYSFALCCFASDSDRKSRNKETKNWIMKQKKPEMNSNKTSDFIWFPFLVNHMFFFFFDLFCFVFCILSLWRAVLNHLRILP